MVEFLQSPGSLPAGQRVYAIGDVHGCDDKLADIHRQITADLRARPCKAPLLVHLGDYVDRGPDSRGVLVRLMAGDPIRGVPTINLIGNHEQTMLDALSGQGAAMTDWMISGGREALASWGGDADAPRSEWAAHVPDDHVRFMRELALSHQVGGYFFVHAGIRPGVPLAEQAKQDMLSIRQSFLYSEADLGVVVVHGHTPREAPVIRPNRIGIDTGAVFGGWLTCAILEEDRVGFLYA